MINTSWTISAYRQVWIQHIVLRTDAHADIIPNFIKRIWHWQAIHRNAAAHTHITRQFKLCNLE